MVDSPSPPLPFPFKPQVFYTMTIPKKESMPLYLRVSDDSWPMRLTSLIHIGFSDGFRMPLTEPGSQCLSACELTSKSLAHPLPPGQTLPFS